jgi:hypothetical protein
MSGRRSERLGIALRAIALALTACYSQSPLDPKPQLRVDRKLLGQWRCMSTEDDPQTALVTFAEAPGSEREYRVTWQDTGKDPEMFRAYPSIVSHQPFLNATDAREGHDDEWLFVKYSLLRANVLYLQIVNQKVFEDKAASRTPQLARRTLEGALRSRPDALLEWCLCLRLHAPLEQPTAATTQVDTIVGGR